MSLDPAESTLNTGDYHRLGVRESEARARVIRHAAHQLAEPLVRRHLAAPDGQTESDLVEVVTSTYRLLDPRRRANPVERALLTQLEPVRTVEPRWAHPKALARRKDAATEEMRFDAVSFESIPADGSSLFPEPISRQSTESPLGIALNRLASYHDHLQRYRPPSWHDKWYLWAGPVVFILLLLAILPVLKRDSADPTSPLPAKATENPSDAPALPDPEPAPSAKTTQGTGQPVVSAAQATNDSMASVAKTTVPVDTQATVPIEPPASETAQSDVVPADIAPSNSEQSDNTASSRGDPSSDPAKSEQAESTEGTEVARVGDALAAVQAANDQAADNATVETTDADPAGDEQEAVAPQQQIDTKPLAATPRHAPLPSPAELKQSRSRLQKLFADRPEAVTETQQIREVEWLLDLRNDSPPGSADTLAIAQLTVAQLVTAGRYRQAAAIIDELEGQFDAEDSQIGCSTTEQLLESAGSLADHRRIVAWCLMLSEKYFQAELFNGATEITRLGTTSAVKLGDAELRSRLSQRRDAISTARRMSESVWKITERSGPEEATATEAAQAGRYLCLMIRDWEQGVAWLANSSDSRLAAAAQQELRLNEPPDAEPNAKIGQPAVDGGTIAKEWLEASDRFRGRLGESAKLHAYELISRAMESSAGLRTLELKKQLDELREQLPEDLIPPQEEIAPAVNRLAGAGGGQQAMADSDVMEGRLMLNGRDTGTLIRYPPGVQLRQNVIDQIFRALQRPMAPWSLTFEGVLRLEKAATIRFIAAGPTAPDGDMTLRVNGNRLTLADGVRGRSAAVDLAAGVHRVTWQVSGTKLDEAFVSLQDEVSGDRLDLAAPPGRQQSSARADPHQHPAIAVRTRPQISYRFPSPLTLPSPPAIPAAQGGGEATR